MFVKRQLTAAVLSGVMILALAAPALADNGQNYYGGGDSADRGHHKDQSSAIQLLGPEKKASEELNNFEQRVNSDISRALQDGNYSQVKTALNDYIASIDEIESARGAEQTVNGDWQQLRSDQESGNSAAVKTDETTLQADVNTAVAVIQTASTGLETVIQDLKGSTTGNPVTNQTATPTITGTPTVGNTSVSGTAVGGASVVLSLNGGTAQPAVIADQNGNWTVTGLTLQSGNTISVTAQVSGDTLSNAATATVVAVASVQTATPTITGTPVAGGVSVSGTAVAGANVVLSVNGTDRPSVTADGNGNWTVTGLTLVSGNTISVTAQVSGDIVSNGITATVAAAASVQTVTPIITGTLTAGSVSVSGTAVAGANVVLSVNGTAQPSVTADGNGNWTVVGLTLATGNIISVTAQVSGDTVSNAATATVVAVAAQTVTPTTSETPNSGYTSGWSRNRREW